LDYELQLLEAGQEKEKAEKKSADVVEALGEAERLRLALEKQVQSLEFELNKKMAESEARDCRSKAQVREAEKHLDSCEKILQESAQSERKVGFPVYFSVLNLGHRLLPSLMVLINVPLEKIRKTGGGLGSNQRLWIAGPLLSCVK